VTKIKENTKKNVFTSMGRGGERRRGGEVGSSFYALGRKKLGAYEGKLLGKC